VKDQVRRQRRGRIISSADLKQGVVVGIVSVNLKRNYCVCECLDLIANASSFNRSGFKLSVLQVSIRTGIKVVPCRRFPKNEITGGSHYVVEQGIICSGNRTFQVCLARSARVRRVDEIIGLLK
jgi:hypothetical protein